MAIFRAMLFVDVNRGKSRCKLPRYTQSQFLHQFLVCTLSVSFFFSSLLFFNFCVLFHSSLHKFLFVLTLICKKFASVVITKKGNIVDPKVLMMTKQTPDYWLSYVA